MKKFFIYFCLVFFLGLIVGMTVPGDSECVHRVVCHYAGVNPGTDWIQATGAAAQLYQVHDYFFFKTVTNNITGNVVARAYFGAVQFL